MTQLVKHQIPTQVMNSRLTSLSPTLLCADSSEPGACLRFSVSLSLCPSPTSTLSVSKISNIFKKESYYMMNHCTKQLWHHTSLISYELNPRYVSFIHLTPFTVPLHSCHYHLSVYTSIFLSNLSV